MREKVRWASVSLLSSRGVAVQVGVLSVITASSMCLGLNLGLSILLSLLDVLVEAVALWEGDEDAAIICQA